VDAANPNVMNTLSQRESFYHSMPSVQVTALGRFRGFEWAVDILGDPIPKSKRIQWLAEYDVLYSDIERQLWLMDAAQLRALLQTGSVTVPGE
jgi:hypothetical protein